MLGVVYILHEQLESLHVITNFDLLLFVTFNSIFRWTWKSTIFNFNSDLYWTADRYQIIHQFYVIYENKSCLHTILRIITKLCTRMLYSSMNERNKYLSLFNYFFDIYLILNFIHIYIGCILNVIILDIQVSLFFFLILIHIL
jgi:hypothetical protein